MKKLFTYTVPRPFSGYNIPIAIQSCFLRDYASKKKMLFSLPVTEIVKKDTYSMFKKNFKKKKISLAMTSIFILPIKNEKKFNNLIKDLNDQTNLHFVLENLILNKKGIFKWRKDYLELNKLSKNYNSVKQI